MKKSTIILLLLVVSFAAKAEDIIQVLPKTLTAGMNFENEDAYLELEMRNTTYDELANLQFDILLPEGVHYDDYYEFDGNRVPFTSGRGGTKWGFNIDAVPQETGYIRFMFTPQLLNNELKPITGNEGVFMRIYITTDNNVKPGIYPVKISNTKFVKSVTEGFYVDDNVSYIVIDGEKEPGAIYDLGEGTLPSFVQSELNGMDNIVVNGTCNNLVITDGAPMNFSAPFTAVNVSYDRNVANDWGTICLPYAINSDDDIQLYQLKEKSGETLIFSEVASLEAGKPGVFKRLDSSSSITMSASNAPIVVSVGEGNVVESLKMIGTFEDITVTVDPSAPSYYIKDNTFLKGNGNFKIPAYRAYFQSEVTMSAKVLNIAVEDEETGIRTVVGKLDTEKGEIYSINGMKISKPSRNSLYIKNGKKYFAK